MRIKLRVREADLPPRTLLFSKPVLTIGRSADCTIRLAHQTVSRHHARMDFDPRSGFTIEDLHSRAGTFLNESPVHRPMPLHQGDEVVMGQASLLVLEIEAALDGGLAVDENATIDETVNADMAWAFKQATAKSNAVIIPEEESARRVEVSTTRVADSYPNAAESPAEAVEALEAGFARFWQEVKVRTPPNLAGQMQALRDAVETRIQQMKGFAGEVSVQARLAALMEAATVIVSLQPLKDRLDSLLDLALKALAGETAALLLHSQRRALLSVSLQRGTPVFAIGTEIAIADPPADERQDLILRTMISGTAQAGVVSRERTIQCVPLRSKTRLLGVLYLERGPSGGNSQDEAKWLESLASMAALAVENARLIEQKFGET